MVIGFTAAKEATYEFGDSKANGKSFKISALICSPCEHISWNQFGDILEISGYDLVGGRFIRKHLFYLGSSKAPVSFISETKNIEGRLFDITLPWPKFSKPHSFIVSQLIIKCRPLISLIS